VLKKINSNIFLTRGDTARFDVSAYTKTRSVRVPYEFTSLDVVTMTVKETPASALYLFQKTGYITTVEDTAVMRIDILPSDTSDLDLDTYYYDVQILIDGSIDDVHTIITGELTLTYEVTY